MRKVSLQDLRYRFAHIERLFQQGKELEITKRKQVIARLLPVARRPDFLARLRRIYGSKKLKVSGAQLLAQERERD